MEPKCPKCKIVWYWDWSQDCYHKSTGEFCRTEVYNNASKYFCDCGQELGVMNEDGSVTNIDVWKDIDWEVWRYPLNIL